MEDLKHVDIVAAVELGEEVDGCIARMAEVGCGADTERLMKKTKQILTSVLAQCWDCVEKQQTMFQDLLAEVQTLRSGLLVAQNSVIKLQGELLAAKDEQLQSVQTAVKDTVQQAVQQTVQTEIKSYSQAVAKVAPPRAALTTAALKKAMKEAVDENDRSRNLMVFGLSEDEGEQLVKKVDEVFQQLGERPRIEATRVGVQSTGKTRPVKVTVSNPAMVLQILAKARNLKHDVKHKDIFICPDRTLEQRAEQRKLVISRKKKAAEEPNKRHFIRGGRVCSEQISAT